MRYVSKKWQFEFTAPEGWTIRPSGSEKWLPRPLAMLSPTGTAVLEVDSPFGLAMTVRGGRRLMSLDALSEMVKRVDCYSKGSVSLPGAEGGRFFALDAFGPSEACKITIHRGDVQFDVSIPGEDEPPDWFTNGWKFL